MFGKSYNNHHMYCIIDFQSQIRKEVLECAMNRSLEVFPVLKSSYVTGAYRAYWLEDDHNSDIQIELVEVDVKDSEITEFLWNEIKETSRLQMKAKIIRNKEKDRICISINHMVCDAADFKQYIYILGSIYTELLKNRNYKPNFIYDGSRSGARVYLKFLMGLKSRREQLRALFHIQNHKSYPLTMKLKDKGPTHPFIATRVIDRKHFLQLKKYCEKQGVTINDIFLAAFIRTIYKYIPNQGEDLHIPCMVDLRRFLKEEEQEALKNLTSTLIVSIEKNVDEERDQTVRKVHQKVTELINHFPALDGYLYLLLLFKLLPIRLMKAFIDKHFKSFPIAFSNLGIIDEKKLRFGDTEIQNCMMTGSIKQKPCFWLALSSFDGEVTLSINLNGSSEDQLFVEQFMEDLEGELPA